MKDVMSFLLYLAMLSTLVFFGYAIGYSNAYPYTITIEQITIAQELCANANSRLAQMSAINITCVNGGEFRYNWDK